MTTEKDHILGSMCSACRKLVKFQASMDANWWFGEELDEEVQEICGFKDLQHEEEPAR
jgi:Zn ribbon nucleic-acid-binding protein